MKLQGKTKAIIPYHDQVNGELRKNYTVLTFNGTVDIRRVRREVRKFVLRNFNMKVSAAWLRYGFTIQNDTGVDRPFVPKEAVIEAWIQRMQDETEDESDSSGS